MYANYIKKTRKAIKEAKNQAEAINSQMDELTNGAKDFKQKIEIRKKEEYQTLLNDYCKALEKVQFLEKCLKAAIECNAKNERNIFKKAIQENIDKLNKPIHYKKTQEALKNLISENNLSGFCWPTDYNLYYKNKEYHEDLYLCRVSNGTIDPDQDFTPEEVLKPGEITSAVKKAYKLHQKYTKKIEEANAIYSQIRAELPSELLKSFDHIFTKNFY